MRVLTVIAVSVSLVLPLAAASPDREKGTVAFKPLGDQQSVPQRYRLAEHSFDFQLEPKVTLLASQVDVLTLRFPSPVETPLEANNTVHAEFYRPHGDGPFPGVVVLDIWAGDGQVARLVAAFLAQRRIAALYVTMPHYGPRRTPGSKVRMMSLDVRHTADSIRQAVLDARRAGAWLASRPDIDATKLGIVGVSLGSFTASLTAEMDPRFRRVAVVLGGGGLVEGYYDDPRARPLRLLWEGIGGSRKTVEELLAPIDPLTCAANLKDRKLLIIAAKHDEVVPARMADLLWKASGRQAIEYFDCGHITLVLYVAPALERLVKHFGE